MDFKKELRTFYAASAKEPQLVTLPAMNFLMVDGEGDPNTAPSFAEAMQALFSVAYALKFKVKKGALAIDYGVMPAEGLWWADDMLDFKTGNKANWKWTLMVMQPEFITKAMVDETKAEVLKKKQVPALEKLRFETFAEGKSAQIMHIGPYSTEGPTIERLHTYIAAQGHSLAGKHHEIYLSDMRKGAPEKWKTIVRQPYM
jgi:hypothetical protein